MDRLRKQTAVELEQLNRQFNSTSKALAKRSWISTPRSSKRLLLKRGSKMAKFPAGAPNYQVVRALELLGRGDKYLQSCLEGALKNGSLFCTFIYVSDSGRFAL